MSGLHARSIVRLLLAASCLIAAVSETRAQQASSIAGVVRDTSGGVLPGVTVEVSSPVLIEKVRAAATDGEGRFNIVDLRPGTYVVTFTLAGFNTLQRDGIVLSAGFTATVNADLQVGALEETIIVSGAAPLVDTQRVQQQQVVTAQLLDALPTGMKALNSVLVLTPGLSGAAAGVGSSQGTYRSTSVNASYHGKREGGRISYDGMNVTNTNTGTGAAGYIINGAYVEEMVLEAGGVSPEMSVAGFNVNFVPREGGNTFRGSASGTFANHSMQSGNLTDGLIARGLRTVSTVEHLYDAVATVGGPIRRDRLWFFAGSRRTGTKNQWAGSFWNKTQGTPVYTPDLDRPAHREDEFWSQALRLTWQASPRNKINVFADPQHNVVRGSSNQISSAPEAVQGWDFRPQGLYQVSWNSPRTSRLLFEAGASWAISAWPQFPLGGAKLEDISILEQATGVQYNTATNYTDPQGSDRYAQRVSVAYVTGSHAFKVGMQLEQGTSERGWPASRKVGFNGEELPGNFSYTFLNGVPVGLTQYASPFVEINKVRAELGIFAQDSWRIRRVTLSYGLRFEYFNGHVPAQHAPANAFMPERNFEARSGVPLWKDINPRLGVAYDVFGHGRTAVKGSIGRYSTKVGVVPIRANNPITATVDTVNRAWTDTNRNLIPDCVLSSPLANGECGAMSNSKFGQVNITSRYADSVLRGWHTREYIWDSALELQHQLTSGISATFGYYRNWAGNRLVTDNLMVTPADYEAYAVTAPVDPRLPGGGGYAVTGLYDIRPEKFGLVDNLIAHASDYGKREQYNDFFATTLNARFANDVQLGGGLDTGRSVDDRCFVVDSPQELLYCRVVWPFSAQTQLKLFGSYPLPFGLVVSGIFRNESSLRSAAGGQTLSIEANRAVPNSEIAPSLGRSLAGGARTATVPLVAPYTLFEGRLNQLDLRLTKNFTVRRTRLQANVDLYNALNASPVTGVIGTYGPRWLQPTQILEGRLIQLSGQLTF